MSVKFLLLKTILYKFTLNKRVTIFYCIGAAVSSLLTLCHAVRSQFPLGVSTSLRNRTDFCSATRKRSISGGLADGSDAVLDKSLGCSLSLDLLTETLSYTTSAPSSSDRHVQSR